MTVEFVVASVGHGFGGGGSEEEEEEEEARRFVMMRVACGASPGVRCLPRQMGGPNATCMRTWKSAVSVGKALAAFVAVCPPRTRDARMMSPAQRWRHLDGDHAMGRKVVGFLVG